MSEEAAHVSPWITKVCASVEPELLHTRFGDNTGLVFTFLCGRSWTGCAFVYIGDLKEQEVEVYCVPTLHRSSVIYEARIIVSNRAAH